MTRFNDSQTTTVGHDLGQTELTVKVQEKDKDQKEALVQAAHCALTESQKRLSQTLIALDDCSFKRNTVLRERVIELGPKCFAIEWNKLEERIGQIRDRIRHINNGLYDKSLIIKTSAGDILREPERKAVGDKLVHGVVSQGRQYPEQYDEKVYTKYIAAGVRRENKVIKDHHFVCDSEGNKFIRGTIRINGLTLQNKQLGVVTLLHEASHRFVNTNDDWYFDDLGPLSEKQPTVSNANTLLNADSYAWFIYLVGDDFGASRVA